MPYGEFAIGLAAIALTGFLFIAAAFTYIGAVNALCAYIREMKPEGWGRFLENGQRNWGDYNDADVVNPKANFFWGFIFDLLLNFRTLPLSDARYIALLGRARACLAVMAVLFMAAVVSIGWTFRSGG